MCTDHDQFIAALASRVGDERPDYTRLAAILSDLAGKTLDRETIYKWRERGVVPWRWRPLVAEMAHERGLDLPEDFLLPRREAAHG